MKQLSKIKIYSISKILLFNKTVSLIQIAKLVESSLLSRDLVLQHRIDPKLTLRWGSFKESILNQEKVYCRPT